jgi:NHLM bacteriocin system ABC transporter ATP-binding protein
MSDLVTKVMLVLENGFHGVSENGNHDQKEKMSQHPDEQAASDWREPEGKTSRDVLTRRPVQERLLNVLHLLEKEQGIDFNLSRNMESGNAHLPSIADLCAAAGVRYRRIVLSDRWWEYDCGPILGFQAPADGDSGKPVLLVLRRGCYYIYDLSTHISVKVNETVVRGLQPEAYVFYRPLPGVSLKLKDLLHFGVPARMADIVVLAGATICTGLLALLTPLVTRRIVNFSIPRSNRFELMQMAAALVIGALAAGLFELVRTRTLLRLKSASSISLQAALWDRMLSLPASFFRGFSIGDLVMRAMGISGLQHLLTSDVTSAVFGLFSAFLSLIILFYYSWRLGLVAIFFFFSLALLTAVLGQRQLLYLRELRHLEGKLSALAYGLLGGIAKLRIAGAEKRAFSVWAERFSQHRRQSIAVRQMSNLQAAFAAFNASAAPIAFFVMLGLSKNLGLGTGDYLAFNAAFAQFQAAAMVIIGVVPTLLGFVPTYERMRPILRALPESGALQLGPGPMRGQIELRNVSFRYNDGPPVLENISLHVAPGDFVAIVGPSGSGKSTCLRLILGFEHPCSGSVHIDQHDVASLKMSLVRREIGVVLQKSGPMVGDIFHNIVGSLPLTIDDAWWAARLVGLEEEIRSMPMNMFTLVNQRGVSFSGGQRQRLLLARALVARPRILLLDEATSALDNQTQHLITRNLDKLGVTRVVIAHRLSTIRNADRIYVLDSQRIIEQGTFVDLINRGGVFARMTERQMVSR